ECAKLVLEPGAARDRLTGLVHISRADDAPGILEKAFLATVACEPIEKKLREAVRGGRLAIRPGHDTATAAKELGLLTADEVQQWQRKEALRKNVIKVDDFPQDFGRAEIQQKLGAEKPQPQVKAV